MHLIQSSIAKIFALLVFLVSFNSRVTAQVSVCPPNIDFEAGDFSNWNLSTGAIASSGAVTWVPSPVPAPNQHTIINTTAGTDTYGRFPKLRPGGGSFNIMLGDNLPNSQARKASYTFTIPATATSYSILFYCAIVLQDPPGTNHSERQRPRFQASLVDVATGLPLPCVSFDFIATANLPGFVRSSIDASVWYRDWTPLSLNLSAYAGRTLTLEFSSFDCSLGGHFGYAYLDVSNSCSSVIAGNTICPGDTSLTISAPFGFSNYEWYSDQTYSTLLSTTQTVVLNPLPTVGSVYPVVVTPYTGFGCKDTLLTQINIGHTPISNAGADRNICRAEQIQLGAPAASPNYNYSWTPAAQVSNSFLANPLASLLGIAPTEFQVKTTDATTGCYSYDTVIITGRQADTALTLNGRTSYCVGDAAPGILSVSSSLVAVQWYNGNIAIPGATGFNYQPTLSGIYWAQIKQIGCTDSTRKINFTINPIPLSIAGADVNICINETKQIGTTPNAAYTYAWLPTTQVSNATIANPQVWVIGTTPQEFTVVTTNAITGCNSSDTITITGLVMDTALAVVGKNEYCIGDPAKGELSVNPTVQTIQWYNGNALIPGATNPIYQPSVSGDYWAQLGQAGCLDSTRTISFAIHPVPKADFKLSSDSACITNHSFTFTNQSIISDGSVLAYLWSLSDGTTQTVTDAVKTFVVPGTYLVRLKATSVYGCFNTSADSNIYVMPNAKPAFIWDSICINRPVLFTNLTNEANSPLVKYLWQFNNGSTSYTVKNLPYIIFNTVGHIPAVLKTISLGCENFSDSVVKSLQVNKPKQGINYRPITVPQGTAQFINVRDTIGSIFNWRPQVYLSNYNKRFTEFYAAGGDMKYFIDITDLHTCITTDTLLMQVLKKPGYYLPTAFTPNGDGLNDVAIPYLLGMKGLKRFSIFNRWGNRVFYTTKYEHGWDGRFNGKLQGVAVYVWVLEFYDANNQLVTEKGTIAIVK